MKQNEFLEIIEQNKGKHRQSLETLIQGRKNEQFNYNPLPVVIATDDTNLPLMNIARTYGWIEQDATEFYESEANNITDITEGITNTFVNTHTQETLDTPFGEQTLDLWYDKDENKWYDATELLGEDDFILANLSLEIISPIKSQDGETASLYDHINWTDIEHFNEFKYFTSITNINNYAFSNCSGLTSIIIPNSVTSIGQSAFYGCSSLTNITIPDSVTSIGDSAFRDCSGLTSIEIPNGVTSIGQYAFRSCSGLTSINVNDGNTVYDSRNNCNAIIETETNTLIQGCNTTIIPDSVTSIGNTAFERCTSLTSVTIGNGVTSIGSGVFQYCSGLTSVTIPDSVTSIGTHVFNGCTSLTSCTIGSGVTSIGQATFRNCSGLTSVDLPNRVTSIGDYAFSGCTSLEEVTIPNGVTSIGGSCFYNCTSLTSIVIPDSVTSIGTWVFQGCSGLTSCTIGNSITNIVEGTFGYCSSLTSIVIPNGVTVIGQYAFYQCYSLTSINIPDSVTSIGYQAFRDCTSLTSIVSNAMKAPTIQGQTFRNVKTGGTLTVPTGSTGYDVWMGTGNYYLGKYNWTKVEQ